MQKIVLLGGGYGNMRILQRLLTNDLPSDVQLTLIDRLPYHCLKTEYYALAAGTESDHHLRVSFPNDPRLEIKYGNISSVDLDGKTVHIDGQDEAINYDTLIIGLGCEDKYHNVPGAREETLSIQSMEDTRKTGETLNNVRPQGVVSIVGGGLSGVELASELRESRPDLTIKLFDRGDIILSMFPYRLSNYVQNWFINHGVEVINKSNITKVEKHALYNHDERIESDAIIWTAGIQPNRVVREMDVEKDQQGRVKLTPHHHLPNDENVFVVGDCASLPHAPSAQLAEGQGEQIVTVLKKRWKNEPLPETFPTIKLKGVLGSLGKKHGFGLMGERTLLGRVPRVMKSGVLWMYKYHSG
ncbi:NAD(P)/FAD-dependent oxidoreductase [Desertibacillus haloalkaliphilus]|uniref:NAD(P)/FAD-dependent oxidoreductase n=1 Tax=Desertibacillus haloalkaliphilus TaxID=1328930 RepID=UPI0028AD6700|nr:NAD(P)/FAD-dependent oxidoreductase [Desertibacillus haloalkaliphilus]